ncbi:MAG: efflux RND transporter permease subunit [Opitutales bacterium]
MIAWFARNGVAANLLAAAIVTAGIAGLLNVKIELFPQFSLDRISVTVPYRGASPAEVETQVIERVEEAIQDVEGIKEVVSTANEGVGTVVAEIDTGYDAREVLDDIKTRVDAISTFPVETERPVVQELLIRREVMGVNVSGNTDERTLKELAERVRSDILELPGVTQVEIDTARDYEISIEVSEETLRRYNLRFTDIASAVRNFSIDVPGGNLRTRGGEILLRTQGQAYVREDFLDIPVVVRDDGSRLTVGDLATVEDGFVENPVIGMLDGLPSIGMTVYEVGDQNPLDIASKVKAFLAEKQAEMPPGIKLTGWRDITVYLTGRLNMLISNGAIGFGLVLLVLGLFLRPSLAFWVTLGIPISFLGTFALMPWFDVSINLISLFGFILVLGIVVDDAIVVGESVFTEFQKGGHRLDATKTGRVNASIAGTRAVSTPVTFAVLTTAVAFTPLLNLPGFQGKFLKAIPLVVIPTLLWSLVESKLVLPYHLSLCKVGKNRQTSELGWLSRVQRSVANGLERFIDKVYNPLLRLALKFRYASVAAFVGIFILTMSLVAAKVIRFMPFPPVPSDYIFVNLAYPDGTPIEITQRGLDRVDRALNDVVNDVTSAGRENPIKVRSSILGAAIAGGGPGGSVQSGAQSHLATYIVELQPGENRSRQDNAVALSNRWREAIGQLPGIKELSFEAEAAGGQGSPVNIQVNSRNRGDLRPIADEIRAALGTYSGLYDITDNLADGQPEIQLGIKPEAELLGLSQADLGQQVRAAFFGIEAQRVQRGREDVRVMVRYPEEERVSVGDLENLRIRTPDGREVPIQEVAEFEIGTGFASIRRVDRQRVVNIFASADKTSPGFDLEVIKDDLVENVLPEIFAKYPGANYTLEGESRETEESNAALLASGFLVLVAIYAMLAIPFKSYTQPVIVITAIPFGLVGAILGHWIMDKPISTLSVYGIMALTGVVVNDSLVLVDFINRQFRGGHPLLEAVRTAGAARFRPILLTSLTTFCGLIPILLERSLQAQFLIPMAISLSFGILFATGITLLLVPASYMILEDIKVLIGSGWNWFLGHGGRPELSDNRTQPRVEAVEI